jgi:hypothetical protein
MRVADFIMGALAGRGVRHVFFVPGGGAMHLNDALGAHPGLEPVCNLHEQASAVAADAYAKITGGLGACLVTTGPGDDDRPLRRRQQPEQRRDLVGQRPVRPGGRGREALELVRLDGGRLHVERDVEPDGAAAAGRGQVDGLLDVVADRVRVFDRHGIFGDRPDDVDDADLLDAEDADAAVPL